MSGERVLITRPDRSSGLGGNLLSLAAALHAAERTKRTLVVDWTEMVHLRNPQTNYFTAFFEPIRRWRSVDVLYVNDPDEASRAFHYDSAAVAPLRNDQYASLLAGQLNDPQILLETFHFRLFEHSGLSRSAVVYETRELFCQLVPRPYLRERLAALQHLFRRRIVVALNIRSGNGEFAPGKPYWKRVNTDIFTGDNFLKRVRAACRDCCVRFPESVRSDWAIYVVTDSREMQQRLLQIDGTFAIRQGFPPPGVGHQFADFDSSGAEGYSDIESANETIIDMLLMANCHGMVCNQSAYNAYAQHVTMFYCGNVRLIERYFENPIKSVGRVALQTARGESGSFWHQ